MKKEDLTSVILLTETLSNIENQIKQISTPGNIKITISSGWYIILTDEDFPSLNDDVNKLLQKKLDEVKAKLLELGVEV